MTKPAKLTKNEKARIGRLKKLRVLDSASEKLFDEITKLASDICGMPIALITLVDEKRQWFKANIGLEGIVETHRDVAFCAHAILEDKLFEVEDATKDSRFKNNPVVTSDPNVIFYAGMPLMLPDGYNIGTLCVIDTKPNKLSDSQRQTLVRLSVIVTEALLLRGQGFHDSLTSLIKRSEFESILTQSLDDYRQSDTLSALMFIDLDDFKIVNDTCGHVAGDQLLKEISSNIKSCLSAADSLARIGGDEFAIILLGCDSDKAVKIANSICESVANHRFAFDNQRFRISASIGLVAIDSHWSTVTSLLQAAELACSQAKYAGRNRVHLHHDQDGILARNQDESQWANRLEIALKENRFEIFAQRIIPMLDGELEHAEVLLRLRSRSGELIAPGQFLPSAERFHMMGRIDRWVVKETFAWIGDNISQLAHIENIAINLSGQSLNDKTFHDYVTELIGQVEFDPAKICFEITETIAISNIADAIAFLESLKQYGVQFSLDDFGSGVSSFGYLKTLPIDCLKIDGQFIKDLANNKVGQATVKCIAEIAKITHKKTIAEYVESEQVEDILKEMGIDFTQGFHRHKPAPIRYLLEEKCNYSKG